MRIYQHIQYFKWIYINIIYPTFGYISRIYIQRIYILPIVVFFVNHYINQITYVVDFWIVDKPVWQIGTYSFWSSWWAGSKNRTAHIVQSFRTHFVSERVMYGGGVIVVLVHAAIWLPQWTFWTIGASYTFKVDHLIIFLSGTQWICVVYSIWKSIV